MRRAQTPKSREPTENENTLYHLKNTIRAIWKLCKEITTNGK